MFKYDNDTNVGRYTQFIIDQNYSKNKKTYIKCIWVTYPEKDLFASLF